VLHFLSADSQAQGARIVANAHRVARTQFARGSVASDAVNDVHHGHMNAIERGRCVGHSIVSARRVDTRHGGGADGTACRGGGGRRVHRGGQGHTTRASSR